MAAVMVLCGTCRASLFRPHHDQIVRHHLALVTPLHLASAPFCQ
jgi:hypothetical protein